jgi:hypothetical protein
MISTWSPFLVHNLEELISRLHVPRVLIPISECMLKAKSSEVAPLVRI